MSNSRSKMGYVFYSGKNCAKALQSDCKQNLFCVQPSRKVWKCREILQSQLTGLVGKDSFWQSGTAQPKHTHFGQTTTIVIHFLRWNIQSLIGASFLTVPDTLLKTSQSCRSSFHLDDHRLSSEYITTWCNKLSSASTQTNRSCRKWIMTQETLSVDGPHKANIWHFQQNCKLLLVML